MLKKITQVVAFFLEKLNSISTQRTKDSSNPSMDVIAATDNKRKKNTPKKYPPGMPENATGSTWKISPGPASGSRLPEKTTGKITKPAKIATRVSAKTIMKAEENMLVSSGRKEPYVVITAIATPIEKKAWASAARQTCGVILLKSGSKSQTSASLNPPANILNVIKSTITKKRVGIINPTALSMPLLSPK